MTRGAIGNFILLIFVTALVYVSIKNYKNTIMTQEEDIIKLKNELEQNVETFKKFMRKLDEAKALAESNDTTIKELIKDKSRLQQILSIEQQKVTTLIHKNERILKENAFNIKEVRSMLDTLILKNCEELLAADSATYHIQSPQRN